MQNYQNPTNFFVKVYGNTVKSITGKEVFECAITGLPTPEISLSSSSYSPHPLAGAGNKAMKGRVSSNTMNNDDVIDLEFLIDENFEAYLFLVKWIMALTVKGRTLNADTDNMDFMEIAAVDNQKQTILVFKYDKVHPMRISQIQYSAQVTSPDVLVSPATFAYNSFSLTDATGEQII